MTDLNVSNSAKVAWQDFLSNQENFGHVESIPLLDQSVDLIVCHTVIKHAQNVSQLISEVARTLSEPGFVHLEAPNYLWFYEPHLQIWTIPKLGKSFVKLCAHLQAKDSNVLFLIT